MVNGVHSSLKQNINETTQAGDPYKCFCSSLSRTNVDVTLNGLNKGDY